MKKAYDIPISGAAEPRKVRAEIVNKDGATVARSAWIVLGAGQRRDAQVTLDAPEGEYRTRQVTNTGSNIHEDLISIEIGTIEHRGEPHDTSAG